MDAKEMNVNWPIIVLVGCLILLLAACNQISAPALTDEALSTPAATLPIIVMQTVSKPTLPTQESQKDSTPMAQPIQRPPSSGLEGLIGKAKEDLAQRLRISINSITVTAVFGQEFSTDAFYCRVTKERIARDESPAVISGMSILLSASGSRYEYHASGQAVIFCRPLP